MTPSRLRECLELVGWSQRALADYVGINERQVRRWAAGAAIPEPIAAWIDTLAQFHEANPPPAAPSGVIRCTSSSSLR